MRHLRHQVATFIIFLCILPTCVHAYCGVPEIRPNGEYFQSDVVFTGTVITASYSFAAGGFYRLRVRRIFKGPTQNEFAVHTDSGDSRFPLDKGRTYLLFAYKTDTGLEIDSCGNSDLLSKAAKSVRSIENIPHAPPYGVIEGWVVPETDDIDVSGVRVIVNGRSRNFTAVSDKDGWFHFRAPIGRYKLDFSSGEYHLNPGDTFRYDPHGFVLHAGETASLQVVSVRHLAR
jgi:hypothetical protein